MNTEDMAKQIQHDYIKQRYQDVLELSTGKEEKTILARDSKNGRMVIKKYLPHIQGRVYGKLIDQRHPNIVPVYEIAYGEEQCIVVLEYVSGITLKELLKEKERLPENMAVSITCQILHGLEHIHRLGIVHRDIHPGNILISSDNVVKIIDFGIARSRKENQSTDTSILGTVGFAAPEQFGFAQTDGRSDIYSVGVLLNVMLTGRFPTIAVAEGIVGEIVKKAIRISPDERYLNVQNFRESLNSSGYTRNIISADGVKRNSQRMPGFRTGKRWKQITAVIGYTFMVLFPLVLVPDAYKKASWGGGLFECFVMFITIWFPFIIISNWGDWDRKVKPFCKWEKDIMIAIRIVVAFLLIYWGLELDSLIRG